MKREWPNPKANKSIVYATFVFTAIFFGMVGYFGYFLTVKSETVINNSYNARLDRFSDRFVRGEILSSDGEVLAKTEVAADGGETRVYPYGSLFAHSVGYSQYGKTGIEALANYYLLSSHKNPIAQAVNQLADQKNIGDNVITTLDVGLQKAASAALDGRKGAVIVMEPDTGRVLAMVSNPAFDPNRLMQDWDSLVSGDQKEARLLNRAAQGLYPPGSVFKLVTLLEYVKENPDSWRNFSFDCDGVYRSGDYKISCYHQTAHGHQNLGEAFAQSCNGAFAKLGQSSNLHAMKTLSEQLLFNKELPSALAYNKSSFVLDTGAKEWEVLQTSIGQGNTLVTPMHIALITCAAARGGTLMNPYFIDRVETADGAVVKKFKPTAYGALMTAEQADIVGTAMRMVVTEGTGSALRDAAYSAAGKTGSAEFEAGKETHAWFTGYAPADKPRVAVTVLVEEGGSGGQTAAPIARKLFDRYFEKNR